MRTLVTNPAHSTTSGIPISGVPRRTVYWTPTHPLSGTRQQRVICCSSAEVPRVTLAFETADGTRSLDCESGDILRDVMLAEKVDLYTTWGKIASCNGGGQCGTCIVQVLEGQELLSDKNDTELKKLKKKPTSYRLACQTNVGDGTNSGDIKFKTKPR